MKEPPGVAVRAIKALWLQWVLSGVGTSKSGGSSNKAFKLSFPSISHMCFNLSEQHHALDAHTTNIYTISKFTNFFVSNFGQEFQPQHLLLPTSLTSAFAKCTATRGGGLGSSTIFKKFNEPNAPS